LPDDLRPAAQASAAVHIPGLPGVAVPDASAAVKTTRALTDALLQAKAVALAGEQQAPSAVAKADALIKTARTTFDVAVKMAGQNAQLQKRQIVVSERLTDAADYINQCASEFAEAKAKQALDEDAFDDALLTLRASLERLSKLAARTFSSPGDGVAWLLDATREN
jgi:hypothetical protein